MSKRSGEQSHENPEPTALHAASGSAPDRRKYWGLYFPGMDEWQAQRSHAEAQKNAKAINDFARRCGQATPAVQVKEWPWGREHWVRAVNNLPNVELSCEGEKHEE